MFKQRCREAPCQQLRSNRNIDSLLRLGNRVSPLAFFAKRVLQGAGVDKRLCMCIIVFDQITFFCELLVFFVAPR